MNLVKTAMPSPVGTLTLIASSTGLVAVLWQGEDGARVGLAPFDAIATVPGDAVLLETRRQLSRFLEGRLDRFALPLDFRGTPFQRDVWRALLDIPCGQTRTYGDIALQLGRPAASRAVGAANGRNPLSIVVPCHRLVGANGGLHGFAGGLSTKRWLLDLEARAAAAFPASDAA